MRHSLKLRNTERDFVERKPRAPKGEWLRAAVAFANSAPMGWPAVLFVGVDDEGAPQQGPEKLEDLSKSAASTIEQAYPPIYFDIRPLHIGDLACLAVVIPGSENRPHFAGKSYVRAGPETREASEPEFAELIASRASKAREIQAWAGKQITYAQLNAVGREYVDFGQIKGPIRVIGCNAHYATFEELSNVEGLPPERMPSFSESLHSLELNFDQVRGRLMVSRYKDR
jgi:predicted HTH transcriptional regulator